MSKKELFLVGIMVIFTVMMVAQPVSAGHKHQKMVMEYSQVWGTFPSSIYDESVVDECDEIDLDECRHFVLHPLDENLEWDEFPPVVSLWHHMLDGRKVEITDSLIIENIEGVDNLKIQFASSEDEEIEYMKEGDYSLTILQPVLRKKSR